MTHLTIHATDGGRAAVGLTDADDSAITRAIAIATGLRYDTVHARLAELASQDESHLAALHAVHGEEAHRHVWPSVKLPRSVVDAYLAELGWDWNATMGTGSGCTTHLRADELPAGWIIARISKGLVAVRDGVAYDLADPTRNGTRCVYGYYIPRPDAIVASTTPPAA